MTVEHMKLSKPGKGGESLVLPSHEIAYCLANTAEKHYLGPESGWWILCTDCRYWFPSTFGDMIAHTTDGYLVYGGCAVGDGRGLIGKQRGRPATEVRDAADAALLHYGMNKVGSIVRAVREKRLGPIHESSLHKALAYIKRVDLQGDDALVVIQAASALNVNLK